jgi:hypothetical protein
MMNANESDNAAAVELVVHLQNAARELIGAARAGLTVLAGVMAEAAEAGRAAAGERGARPGTEPGDAPRHSPVEHIRVS